MKIEFDPANEDDVFTAHYITSHLVNIHSNPDYFEKVNAIVDGRDVIQLDTPRSRGELPDPLADAGSIPPPPPPGAPDIEPDLTEQVAEETGEVPGVTSPPIEVAELDAAGVPWDERIHSGGKTVNKDGSWKKRRNLDDAFYQQVVAEITAAPQPAAAPAEAPAAVGAVPPPPAAGEGASAPVDQPAAPPPAPPVPDGGSTAGHPVPEPNGAAAPEFGADSAAKWQDIVQKVMLAKVSEQITMEDVDGQAAALGVTGGFLNMVSRPDLFGQFEVWLMDKGVL